MTVPQILHQLRTEPGVVWHDAYEEVLQDLDPTESFADINALLLHIGAILVARNPAAQPPAAAAAAAQPPAAAAAAATQPPAAAASVAAHSPAAAAAAATQPPAAAASVAAHSPAAAAAAAHSPAAAASVAAHSPAAAAAAAAAAHSPAAAAAATHSLAAAASDDFEDSDIDEKESADALSMAAAAPAAAAAGSGSAAAAAAAPSANHPYSLGSYKLYRCMPKSQYDQIKGGTQLVATGGFFSPSREYSQAYITGVKNKGGDYDIMVEIDLDISLFDFIEQMLQQRKAHFQNAGKAKQLFSIKNTRNAGAIYIIKLEKGVVNIRLMKEENIADLNSHIKSIKNITDEI